MDLITWLEARGGVARRREAVVAGYSRRDISAATTLRRVWLVAPRADPALVEAAQAGGRIACVSAAERLGLSVLRPATRRHLAVPPHASTGGGPHRLHWSRPIRPTRGLVESVPDMLAHVADCLPREEALVIWESALRRRLIGRHEVRRIAWPHHAARRLAAEADGWSDSPLETLLAAGLRDRGVPYRQQVPTLGSTVDFLVGRGLVVQTDGYAYHSSSGQRGRDIEHDARLQLEGLPVLRFDYQDVVHELPRTLDTIERAELLVAAGRRSEHEVEARRPKRGADPTGRPGVEVEQGASWEQPAELRRQSDRGTEPSGLRPAG